MTHVDPRFYRLIPFAYFGMSKSLPFTFSPMIRQPIVRLWLKTPEVEQ